jgi:hypothetical protein
MEKLKQILENYPEAEFVKLPEEFDDCIIGLEVSSMRIVYAEELIIRELMSEGLEFEEAYDHYSYNILGSYIGEQTPIYIEIFINI